MKRRFFVIRVTILLVILFVVVLVAVRDLRSRRARNEWDRTVDVAIVLVEVAGTGKVTAEAVRGLDERLARLEERLRVEADRHRHGMPKPFHFRLFGPVDVTTEAPKPPSDGLLDLVRHAALKRSWLRSVDAKAAVEPDFYDTRIYVSARRPASDVTSFVEGFSEQDGRVGFVDVELDASMVDLTLFVIAHELMHTLGATDKYDESGRALIPDGLAEPERVPRFPQRFAEVMARDRPVSERTEIVPESLDELAVGRKTAAEIGWAR